MGSLLRGAKVAIGFFLVLVAGASAWWLVHRAKDASDREVLTICVIAAIGLSALWTGWHKK
jgi:Kef-type K+ transport system membrane component KefB